MGTDESNPAVDSGTDSGSVAQQTKLDSTENKQQDKENGNDSEMENGKTAEGNGSGGAAGMMSSIVNKVTDFFSTPDEDDEGELPQLSNSDSAKPGADSSGTLLY